MSLLDPVQALKRLPIFKRPNGAAGDKRAEVKATKKE